MSGPGEHKTVQARILHYAQEIRWTYVSREEAKRRRRILPHPTHPPKRAREMMEHQLMTAQIRVHDLDLERDSATACCRNWRRDVSTGGVGNSCDRCLLGYRGDDNGRRRLKYLTQ